jgi:outer membrane protein assembly factor BamB
MKMITLSLAPVSSWRIALLSLSAMAVTSVASAFDPVAVVKDGVSKMKVGPKDWPQWGGTPERNNTPVDAKVPTSWNVEDGTNILWSAALGSESYGNPVVANGKVYVGTNNGKGYLTRYPTNVDLGVLVCFDEKDGKFLWQHSSEKLPTGRVNDWPDQGICCAPMIDGDRGWFVTSRGEVVCFDTEGFGDKENDGPFKQEAFENPEEADIVWKLDMMKELKVFQHNMCACSVTSVGELLFVNTSNGVDEGHMILPQEDAPSFICINRNTGSVLWTDNTPGNNVLHGQWSSPAYGVFSGQAQVLFGGGDGWLYSFDPAGENGKAKLLWKFDCNPKDSKYALNRATRNHLIATPVVYDGLVYIAVGEDPEHGEGNGQRSVAMSAPPWSSTASPLKLRSRINDCKLSLQKKGISNATIQIRQRSGTMLVTIPKYSNKRCTEHVEHARSRTGCLSSPISPASYTAWTSKPARLIGPTTCWPAHGRRR